jgi:hypothetical protein
MAAETCNQAVPKSIPGTAVYRRRQPERSAVYQVIQGHLDTWLAGCLQADEEGFHVAAFIEQDFRKYLECGILAHGFARARRAGCGYDFLIAFSLVKNAETVPPALPGGWWRRQPTWLMRSFHKSLRQWVLSFPKRLRYFHDRDSDLLNRVLRIFLDGVEKALQSCCPDAPGTARLGAVTFVHRFGSALN